MIALAGGASVRCAGYATFGSPELSAHCLQALAGRQACLLANHGAVALGPGPVQAVDLLYEVERLAEVYLLALRGGEPVILPDEEIPRVAERLHRQRRGESLDL
jgi:L-fuculose-phosphate aldolase